MASPSELMQSTIRFTLFLITKKNLPKHAFRVEYDMSIQRLQFHVGSVPPTSSSQDVRKVGGLVESFQVPLHTRHGKWVTGLTGRCRSDWPPVAAPPQPQRAAHHFGQLEQDIGHGADQHCRPATTTFGSDGGKKHNNIHHSKKPPHFPWPNIEH